MLRILLYIALGLLIAGVLVFFFVAPPLVDARLNDTTAEPPYSASDAARALHDTLLVADLHNDFLLWNRDLLARYERGHSDLPRLVDGRVGLQTFSVVTKVPFGRSYAGTPSDSDQITYLAAAQRWPVRTWTSLTDRALYQAEKLHRFAGRSGGRLTVLRTAADLDRFLDRRAQNPDLVVGLLAIEGLQALEGELVRIDTLADAGFRMMGLTHLYDNAVGGSSTGLNKGGLTDFGRQVVRRLDERGLLIDLAHASEAVIDDVLALTDRPVVVSHTGVQGTCDTPRNLSDDHLRAIAAQGGLIGVGTWPTVVCDTNPAAIARAMRYVADLVGVGHVALGTDFDGTVKPPFDATGLPQLTEALLDIGFSAVEIQQIMGGNAVRFLRDALPRGA
jgi:microsomal dipeptidase-like Zn-dependent dipeptidase